MKQEPNQNLKFRKNERLCSKKLFEKLGASNQRINAFPLRLIYLKTEQLPENGTVQAAFVVPKRLFKKAVDRNRIKRQMREAYRLNKAPLIQHCLSSNQKLALLFIYLNTDSPNFNIIQEKLVLILQRVIKSA